jgi:hypothetical protein
MKVLIKESKYNKLIEDYILNGYPVVKNVTFITKDVYLASGDKSERRTIQRTIIIIHLISGQMTHSPSWTMREIRNDINRMFGLGIEQSGSHWGIDYKIHNSTE